MKITKETIKNVGRVVGTIMLYGAVFVAPRVLAKDVTCAIGSNGDAKYSDAVNAITDSNMFSADKTKAIAMLRKNEDVEYYKSVIRVIKSTMFSSDKLKTIANMNGEES